MKINIYIVCAMAIFFIGCVNTEGKLGIKGNVVDDYTKEPIPGRSIIIQGLVERDNKYIPVDAGQFSTDSSGSFSFSLQKIKDAHRYRLSFVGDSDYAFQTKETGLLFLKNNARYLSFSLNRLVGFEIKIYRESKIPLCDTLYLSWKSDGIDGRTLYPYIIENEGLSSGSELRWIGGNVNSTIKTRIFAEKKTTVRWMLFRNGKTNEIIDTITCKRNQVNEVKLIY